MPRSTWIGSLALLLSCAIARSQEPPAYTAGSRLRITTRRNDRPVRYSGAVVRSGADTVVLTVDGIGQPAPFALANATQLEVSRGRHSHAGKGVWIGFLAGAGTGAALGFIGCKSDETCHGGSDGDLSIPMAGIGAALGAGAGIILGAIVGAVTVTDTWEVLPATQWHVAMMPAPLGRTAIGLSVHF